MWLGGRVVREPDLRSTGRGFESRPLRCRVQPWVSCLYTCAPVTKQYNLVPANGRLGREPRAWRKVMAAYRRAYGFSHPRADWRGQGSAPEPHTRFEYGTTFTHYYYTTTSGLSFLNLLRVRGSL